MVDANVALADGDRMELAVNRIDVCFLLEDSCHVITELSGIMERAMSHRSRQQQSLVPMEEVRLQLAI